MKIKLLIPATGIPDESTTCPDTTEISCFAFFGFFWADSSDVNPASSSRNTSMYVRLFIMDSFSLGFWECYQPGFCSKPSYCSTSLRRNGNQ